MHLPGKSRKYNNPPHNYKLKDGSVHVNGAAFFVKTQFIKMIIGLRYSVGVFFEVGFAGFAQFVVPFFAEAGCQRAFEELVEAQAEFAAEGFGRAAYLPAVVVYGNEVGVFSEAERVEVA